ncbi:hypothetical protein MJK72_03620 [Klebsiella pneumoniae]|nr:hypothetical protein MJK72_03620 [Klebsiella pneumoniae]
MPPLFACFIVIHGLLDQLLLSSHGFPQSSAAFCSNQSADASDPRRLGGMFKLLIDTFHHHHYSTVAVMEPTSFSHATAPPRGGYRAEKKSSGVDDSRPARAAQRCRAASC